MSTTTNPLQTPAIRDRFLSRPDLILDDKDVMRALVAANERAMGGNVVDMRAIAMERLEARLDRLEDTHRNVIAAAYENLAGTNMVHRAILRLLEAPDFASFLNDLAGPVAETLRVTRLRLLIEADDPDTGFGLNMPGDVLSVAERGFCCLYAGPRTKGGPRRVTLRGCDGGNAQMYGDVAADIRSEACLMLDPGGDRRSGMLVLGAADPEQFAPGQATDLLDFFAGVFERTLSRWLE